MQPDLQGLEISLGELRHLSGVEPTDVFRPTTLKNPKARWSFFFQEFILSLALTPVIVGLLHVFIILPFIGASLGITSAILILVPIAIISCRWFGLQRKKQGTLGYLLDEVDRYNAVIKAIDINDQLEAAGTTQRSLSDRQNVIQALTLIRQDLLKALRAERILRENQSFISSNSELLISNLRTLQALQLNAQASEYGHLLNEALQIATGVSEEMRKLHHNRANFF